MKVLPFVPSAGSSAEEVDAREPRLFAFVGQELCVRATEGGIEIPRGGDLAAAGVALGRTLALGTLGGDPCRFAALPADAKEPLRAAGLSLRGLRSLFGSIDDGTFAAAGLGASLSHFEETARFCGRCAAALEWKTKERGKVCPACGRDVYPHVSPCVIVLVEDRERDAALLTRSARFPPGMYGLVAGFVEPGESLEECVAREVLEETGVRVDEIRYVASQPWPFPSQLMVGFEARYAGGELTVDETELEDARWFARDAMPKLPPPISIARALLDRWLGRR